MPRSHWQHNIAGHEPRSYARTVLRLEPIRKLLELAGDPHNPTAEELMELFNRLRTIAVIGLSRDPNKAARRVPSYLASRNFNVIPVNPYADRILGKETYSTISDVPISVDLVVIFRPSAEAGQFVIESAKRPERPAIWLQEGIWAKSEIGEVRAEQMTAVQNMCTYLVHQALNKGNGGQTGPSSINS